MSGRPRHPECMPPDAMQQRQYTERPVSRRRRSRRPLPPLPLPSSGFRSLGHVLSEVLDRAPELPLPAMKPPSWQLALARLLDRKFGRGAQSEVARRLGCPPQQVQRWVSGVREPSVSNLLRVLAAAGLGLCDLQHEMERAVEWRRQVEEWRK